MLNKNICVYCSSSEAVDIKYFNFTKKLAESIVKNSYDLVYGGANVGLMRCIAENVKKNGGKVTGIIPQSIYDKGLAFENLDKLIVTANMHERKAKMAELSEIFFALPGGFGTLEEVLEIITLKQLNYHNKPVVIFNQDNFYDGLLKQFEAFYDSKFSKEIYKKLYLITDDIDSAFNYIKNYKPIIVDKKWFDVSKKAF